MKRKAIKIVLIALLSLILAIAILHIVLYITGWHRFRVADGVLYLYQGYTRDVTIPGNVTVIGHSAFAGNRTVRTVYIPYGVTTIDTNAFIDCVSLETINIPNSVTYIGWRAFAYCRSLTSVYIPDSVTIIRVRAFAHCTSLASVRLSENLTAIEHGTFWNNAFEYIRIPDSVTEIGTGAFGGNNALRTVYIGSGLEKLCYSVFLDSDYLTAIHVDERNPNFTSIDGVLFKRADLVDGSVNIDRNLIDDSFNEDTKILFIYPAGREDTFFAIPNNVVGIYFTALRNARFLRELYIPSSVVDFRAVTWLENLTYFRGDSSP